MYIYMYVYIYTYIHVHIYILYTYILQSILCRILSSRLDFRERLQIGTLRDPQGCVRVRDASRSPRNVASGYVSTTWAKRLTASVGVPLRNLHEPFCVLLVAWAAPFLRSGVCVYVPCPVSCNVRRSVGQTEVVATACSGTGAPSFALRELVGARNEIISSESHALWHPILYGPV